MQVNELITDGTAIWRVINGNKAKADTSNVNVDIDTSEFLTRSDLQNELSVINLTPETSVTTATRAMQDSEGNDIKETYLTKSEFDANFSRASGVIRALKSGFASDISLDIEDSGFITKEEAEVLNNQFSMIENREVDFITDDTFFRTSLANKMNTLFNIDPNTRKYEERIDMEWPKDTSSLGLNGVDCVFLCGGKYVCTLTMSTTGGPFYDDENKLRTFLDVYTTYPGITGRLSFPYKNFVDIHKDYNNNTPKPFSGCIQKKINGYDVIPYMSVYPVIKDDDTFDEKGLATSQLLIHVPSGVKASIKIIAQNRTNTSFNVTIGRNPTSSFYARNENNPLSDYDKILPNRNRIVVSTNSIDEEQTEYDLGELEEGENYIDFFKYCNSFSDSYSDDSADAEQVRLYRYEITYTTTDGEKISYNNIITCGYNSSSYVFVSKLVGHKLICTNSTTAKYNTNLIKLSENAGAVSYVAINPVTGYKGAMYYNNFYLNGATHDLTLGSTAAAYDVAESITAFSYNHFIPALFDKNICGRVYHVQTYAQDKVYMNYKFTTSTITLQNYYTNEMTGANSALGNAITLGTRKGDPYYSSTTAFATPRNGVTNEVEIDYYKVYVPLISISPKYIHFAFNNTQYNISQLSPKTYDSPLLDIYRFTYDKSGANGYNPNITKIERILYRNTAIFRTVPTSITDVTYTVATDAVTGGITEYDVHYKQDLSTKKYANYGIIDKDDQENHAFHNKLDNTSPLYKTKVLTNIIYMDNDPYLIFLNLALFKNNIIESKYGKYSDYFKIPYRQDWIDYYFEVVMIDTQTKLLVDTDIKPSILLNKKNICDNLEVF